MSSRPKRVRVGAILLLLLGKMSTDLANDTDGGTAEQLMNLSTALKPQMAKDDGEWTPAENALYAKFDSIGNQWAPEATDPGRTVTDAWPGEVATLIAAL